jgi:sugar transferase (PEP-CTERM system associated)
MMVRIFKHYVPVQVMMLAAVDVLVLFGSMYLGVQLRFVGGDTGGLEEMLPIWPKAVSYAVVIFMIAAAMGLYERDLFEGRWEYYSRFMMSFGLGLLSMMVVFYAVPGLFLGRGAFAFTMLFSMLGMVLSRGLFLRVVGHDVLRQRVLVLGAGSRAAQIEPVLERHKLRKKFDIVGYLPIGASHPAMESGRTVKRHGSLLAIATKLQVDEIIVAVRERRGGNLAMDELLECKLEGINVTDLSTFFERETGHVQLDSVNPSWMVFSDGFCRTSSRNLIKRLFDVASSALLVVLTLPVFVVTALLIVFESGAPIFYRQVRVGECGRPFGVLKFRSMRTDAERDGVPQWAKKGDSRVTRVGSVIRKLRIDELPQLFNVLRGDMSFVGPRPERPFFVRELEKQIPYYSSRHTVKPGITGWAQIRYPYGASVDDAREKLQYDLYYAKNHSLFLDVIILMQTAQVVLLGKGAR